MALSMAVLLVPVLILLILYNVLFNGSHARAIDPSETYATARHGAHFTVLEPAGLPAGWTVLSASYTPVSGGSVLRVGYSAPGGAALQLVESDEPVNSLLPAELGDDAQPGALVTVGTRQWREYPVARDGGRGLVFADNGRTVVITGAGSDADLRVLGVSLH
jgi:hypothetical protein